LSENGTPQAGKPRIGILVGSESDLPVMEKCTAKLEELGVEHEIEVKSAHRNPDAVAEYAGAARDRGLKVIICAAGMAAHLAGAVAGRTNLPVIGIPIAAGSLNGLDALLATVQMPSGVPVATVAVNGAANAAVLAAQILALSDDDLAERLEG
jgi:5-(carboxyamino)imidazole ribonucleotide mutase